MRNFSEGKSRARSIPRDYRQAVTWLIGTQDIPQPTDAQELKRIKAGTSEAEKRLSGPKSQSAWIRFAHRYKADFQQGDNLIMIDRSSPDALPERVYRHAPILHVQREPDCIRVYHETSSNADKQAVSWARFKRLAKRAGINGAISKNATRRLTDKASADLRDYWTDAK